MEGVVIKSVGDIYNVKINNNIIKCNYRGKNKLNNVFSNPIVSGDKVIIQLLDNKNGIIEKIIERKNYFLKRSLKDKKAHIIGANLDQVLIMGSIKSPYTKLNFIDKCIAASIYYNIKPILVFNKIDLLDMNEKIKLKDISKIYNAAGIETLNISAFLKINLDKLLDKLSDNKTLILGNSGVGKSTLINTISTNSKQKTDRLSLKTGRGKQTTTFSETFEINRNSQIIDSPGFKEFYFFDINKNDLKFLYPEFKSFNNECKFNNCLHQNEPKCSVKNNIGKNISERRYNNYLSLLEELN
tara:strand:- start:3435 stop:4331 length:897 start_codon:yes stop_codon:yes gene_type:complete